jgi:glycosyltransferase involved in cell wall biosynthesis
MRIAYVSGNQWPGREPGLSFSLHFARGLAAAGADATVALLARTPGAAREIERDFYGPGPTPRVLALRAPLLGGSRFLYYLRVVLHLLVTPYDVVVFRALTFLPWAVRLKRWRGVPVWFEAHDFWTDPSLRDDPVRRTRRRHIRLEQRWVRETDGIVCVSEPQAELYRRCYPHLPVVTAETSCQPPSPVTRDAFAYTLGYVGSLNEAKYPLSVVLRAMARVGEPRLRLLVVGARDDAQRVELERLAADLGVADRVEVHGWKVGAELAALEERMDLGIACLATTFLNRIASPLKILEYLSRGLPFVSTRLPGIENLVTDGVEGFLVENTPEAWAAAIESAYADFGAWRRMSERCTAAAERMSWERRAGKVLDALREARAPAD